jgi:hypothetical protein
MTWCWFHEYLQARANDQFDLDFTVFRSKVFIESVGEGTLHRFITSHLLERFSEELAHTLQNRESRCLDKEKPNALLDDVEDAAVQTQHCLCDHREHQPGICTASDEMSFDFPNVPYEEMYDVISLESSVCDKTPPPPPEPEPVPEPEPESEPPASEPVPEEPTVDPFAGHSTSQKKKLQDKMKKDAKEAVAEAEEDAKQKEENDAAAVLAAQEAEAEAEAERLRLDEADPEKEEQEEMERLEQEEAERIAAEEEEAEVARITEEEAEAARIVEEEAEAARIAAEQAEAARIAEEEAGAARLPVSLKDKKKKKKSVVIEKDLASPPPEPENDDPDAARFDLVKDIPEDQLLAELKEDVKAELITDISSTLCPRLSYHLSKGDGWKSCERCRARIREIAAQLEKENKAALLPQ